VGSRLIDAAARKMADDFFGAFSRELGVPQGGGEPTAPGPAAAAPPSSPRYEPSAQWKVWAAVFLVLVIALVLAL